MADRSEPERTGGVGAPTRQLNYLKCIQCRVDKQKCEPKEREWPEKCKRCISKDLECSENMSAEDQRARVQLMEEDTSLPPRVDPLLEQFAELSIDHSNLLRSHREMETAEKDLRALQLPPSYLDHLQPALDKARSSQIEERDFIILTSVKIIQASPPHSITLALLTFIELLPYLEEKLSTDTSDLYDSLVFLLAKANDAATPGASMARFIRKVLLLRYPEKFNATAAEPSVRTPTLDGQGNYGLAVDRFLCRPDLHVFLESQPPTAAPLHWAAMTGCRRFIKEVESDVSFNCSVHAIDSGGETPLSLAASTYATVKTRTYVMDYLEALYRMSLVEKYCDCTKRPGWTLMYYAAAGGHAETVQAMMSDRAFPLGSASNLGRTPLSLAAEHGHSDVVSLLVNKGAALDVIDHQEQAEYGRSATMLSTSTSRDDSKLPSGALKRKHGESSLSIRTLSSTNSQRRHGMGPPARPLSSASSFASYLSAKLGRERRSYASSRNAMSISSVQQLESEYLRDYRCCNQDLPTLGAHHRERREAIMKVSATLHAAALLSASASFAEAQRLSEWIPGQLVNTTSGPVLGQASAWQPLVSEYLGVPYAQPPVGALRFAAPAALKRDAANASEPFAATAYGASCPVNINSTPGAKVSYRSFAETLLGRLAQLDDVFDEDCLKINVWTAPQIGCEGQKGNRKSKKAVMVWIYGGGFNSGSSTNAGYNGARLAAEHDVVVVSMNYRTNIFGFPRADFLPDLNLGLLDQRLAVEWVRDNIEKFGGDPSRITLFGQSAGGASVDYYTLAWLKDPIAHAFIAQSGMATDQVPSANISAGWYTASQALGCGGVDAGKATLECMREKPWQDIMAALEKRGVTPNLGQGGFGPTVDEKVVFANVTGRRREGMFIRQPMLVGNTGEEAAFYRLLAAANGRNSSGPEIDSVNLIRCGPGPVAASRVAQGVPAWRYVYEGEYPNTDIGFPGAWHGAEIAMAFGTNEFMSRRQSTAAQKKLSLAMRTAWTQFAKKPRLALTGLGWPVYAESKRTTILLGGPNSSSIAFKSNDDFTVGCPSRAGTGP
ncbi:unnamed protein product [Parascedosporium putredinis]|uniref:Zn(2)-C6 fungal-type domain-containing protein n=1 Tax=Parascedosporium putredinis TaxID=1442378 RepID=A0A9P1M955_9PEZI|nr:unnamed protein product [Parascedosporium putredinis]CAI7994016.1 unnamed protein product [Parascedosporium putredinis]